VGVDAPVGNQAVQEILEDHAEAAVEVGQKAVAAGHGHGGVKVDVGGHVAVHVTSGMGEFFSGQMTAHGLEIGFGAVGGGKPGRFHLDDAADFPDFLGRGPTQAVIQRFVTGGAVQDVRAVALAHFEQAGVDEHAHGLAHGGSADTELGHEHRLGGNLGARCKEPQGDFLLDLLNDEIAQLVRADRA